MATANATAPEKRKNTNYRFPRLPAPFADIGISSHTYDRGSFIVTYTGTAERLLEAGAIEPCMLNGAPTASKGDDSHGFRYWRNGRIEKRIEVTRFIGSSSVVESLPGCRDRIPAYFRWLRENPGEVHVEEVYKNDDYIMEHLVGRELDIVDAGYVTAAQMKDRHNTYGRNRFLISHDVLDGLIVYRHETMTEAFRSRFVVKGIGASLSMLEDMLDGASMLTPDVIAALRVISSRVDAEKRQLNKLEARKGMRLVVDNEVPHV